MWLRFHGDECWNRLHIPNTTKVRVYLFDILIFFKKWWCRMAKCVWVVGDDLRFRRQYLPWMPWMVSENPEWNYVLLKSFFRLLSQLTMSLRLRQSAVGDMLMVSMLFRNFQVAFQGNISSGKFMSNLPTFAEYVAAGPRAVRRWILFSDLMYRFSVFFIIGLK